MTRFTTSNFPRGAAAVLLTAGLMANVAFGQDTRRVTEPVIPPACTTLQAHLATVGDSTIADSDEKRPDTERIQRALDACPSGHAVMLAASGKSRGFLTAPIHLRAGVALVVGEHAILFGSRDPRDYDVSPGTCGVVSTKSHGCRALITADHVRDAGVMGPGTINGRGWAPLLGKSVSWWGLAELARASYKLSQNCPRMMDITHSDNFTLYRVTLRNSPNFHVVYDRGDGFTAWGVVINTPRNARNTDGIDPSSATNVTITHSFISTGDDNVAIKAGSTGAATHITISHDHFYSGHGVSIGSETNGGASAIRIDDLSVDGADNALRIKSNSARGGLVQDVQYHDVCIRHTKNPIFMDTHYTASAVTAGSLVPVFRDIAFRDIRVLDSGTVTLDGYDESRPLTMTMDDVVFDQPGAIKIIAKHAQIAQGPGPMNLPVSGEDVHVTGTTADAPAMSCAGKFVANPKSAEAATAKAAAPASPYAAIVDSHFTGTDGALVSGTPTYRTLGAAVTSIPQNGQGRAVVFVRNGRYHEKLTIDRPYLTVRGESRDGTVLTFDAAAGSPAPGGGEYGTRGSFTLRIVAPDFRAENLTIENAFDYATNAAKPDSDRSKLRGSQGAALMLDTGSDRATFINVRITGNQDTLFANVGRAYFYGCEIRGNVDFIFGAGRAVFDNCTIVSIDRRSQSNNGYVTAPSTLAAQPFGFLFWHSRLEKELPSMARGSVTLGRPWHPFANPAVNSSVVYVDCWMDDHISERGWDRMSSVDSTGTRVWYLPQDARFLEYGSSGPGAIVSPPRRQLKPDEVAAYTPAAVLDGWVPTH